MKNLLIIILLTFAILQLNAQVSINTTGSDPNSSAMLDVQSTDKGMLIPRMTETQRDAITSPAEGLMIYQTDGTAGFYYWNGTAWTSMAGSSSSATHYVGELYGGGIVFWVDQTGEPGLIASLDDLNGGSGVSWSNITSTEIGASAKSMTDGLSNSNAIVGQSGHTSSAAKLCLDYSITTDQTYDDWYLPSNRELYLLASQDILIDKILDNDGDANTNGFSQEYTHPTYGRYWSSTENLNNYACGYYFLYSYSYFYYKGFTYRVRAVRAF